MGQFLTDKYLKARAALQGRVIEGDLACEQCAYNLRGLRYSGLCPECGAPIRYRRDAGLAFHEMPIAMIRAYRGSAWLAAAASLGGICVFLSGNWVPPATRVAIAAVVAAVWFRAVWRLTAARDADRGVGRGRLRRAARWLQAGWLVGLAAVGAAAPGAPSGLLGALAVTAFLAGIAGAIVLAFHLERFADRVGAELAAKSFSAAAWCSVPTGLLLLGAIPMVSGGGGTMWPLYVFVIVFVVLPLALVFAVSVLAIPVGLGLLGHTLGWSVIHARNRIERDRRQRERMAARPAPQPEPPETVSLAETPGNGPQQPA